MSTTCPLPYQFAIIDEEYNEEHHEIDNVNPATWNPSNIAPIDRSRASRRRSSRRRGASNPCAAVDSYWYLWSGWHSAVRTHRATNNRALVATIDSDASNHDTKLNPDR